MVGVQNYDTLPFTILMDTLNKIFIRNGRILIKSLASQNIINSVEKIRMEVDCGWFYLDLHMKTRTAAR